LVALLLANVSPTLYERIVHTPLTEFGTLFHLGDTDPHQAHAASTSHGHGHGPWWAHFLTMHFLVNDIFMVLFFGIAAKEITEACLPGGALNPVSKAINPLFGTLGGVLGPVGVYLLLNSLMGNAEWQGGWGIPTATDIALAWLVARFIFGKGHPAVSFLLLLAVADDGIGLGIIAVAYPDPAHPTVWANTAWILPGILIAFALRHLQVQNWVPYVLAGGAFSWWGLYSAHLHPALALVFIVPFLPGPKRDLGMFVDDATETGHNSPLEMFEHHLKLLVDFGLFFFAFANAGVSLSGINNLTWIVLGSLVIGKTVGIFAFSYAALRLGFPLPDGMQLRHLAVAGSVAGIGLTVALFVSGQAFSDPAIQGAAKMGALLSIVAPMASLAIDRVGRLAHLDTDRRRYRLWLFRRSSGHTIG
jgi:NhaA family Na+:H+ antiporter